MELIKKNLGLIIAGVICLALSGFVVVRMGKAAKLVSESYTKVEEQLQFFKGVKQKNIKLNKENVRVAGDNQALAEKKFLELRQQLATESRIDPRPPATALDCLRQLQVELSKLHEKCTQAHLRVPENYMFSFDRIAMSNKLPATSDVPAIFRQLRIVQEIIRVLSKAEVEILTSIERPMNLQVLEEDLYIVTPIRVQIVSEAEQIQAFINMMSTESAYLFCLKKATFVSDDQAPGGQLRMVGDTGAQRIPTMGGMGAPDMGMGGMGGMGGMDMGMGGMGGPDMGMGGMGAPDMGMGGMGAGGHAEGGGENSQMQTMILTRDSLVAFQKNRLVSAELRFDLIEFLSPSDEE